MGIGRDLILNFVPEVGQYNCACALTTQPCADLVLIIALIQGDLTSRLPPDVVQLNYVCFKSPPMLVLGEVGLVIDRPVHYVHVQW